jgi:flagellar biosynthesis regulator FlaF
MNATVTMPIKELDDLRNNLKTTLEELSTYKKNQKKIEVTTSDIYYTTGINYDNFGRSYYSEKKDKRVVSKEYINFEDIELEFKQKAEDKVSTTIKTLEKTISDLRIKENSIEKEYRDKVSSLTITFNNKTDELTKEIQRLKDEKVDLTKDELILKLENEILLLKNPPKRKFFDSWFS